jgi:hypothetical protein
MGKPISKPLSQMHPRRKDRNVLIFTCELCDTTIEDPETDDFYVTLEGPLQVSTGIKRVCSSCLMTLADIGMDSSKMTDEEHALAHQESYIMARLALKAVRTMEERTGMPTEGSAGWPAPPPLEDLLGQSVEGIHAVLTNEEDGTEWLDNEIKAGTPQKPLGEALRDAAEYSKEGLL